jgi:hypothetical protein
MKEKTKSNGSGASEEGSEFKVRRGTDAEKTLRTASEIEASFEEMLQASGLPAPTQTGRRDAEIEQKRVTREEWEKPDPSTIWRGAGGISVAVAAASMIAFFTVPDESSSQIALPLAIGIAGIIVALACAIAHYDVNRGRHPRRSEFMDEVRSEDHRND